jgi:hypothetical protein
MTDAVCALNSLLGTSTRSPSRKPPRAAPWHAQQALISRPPLRFEQATRRLPLPPFFPPAFGSKLSLTGYSNLRFHPRVPACIGAVLLLAAPRAAAAPRPSRDKTVWNYEGGLFLQTNGSIPDGPCFRISGHVEAPGFFDTLKRVDTDSGAVFRRGSDTVTQFPDQLLLQFVVFDHYDQTCPPQVENANASRYLTRAMMSTMHLYLYWKHGVELRPIADVVPKYFSVDPVLPTATARAAAHGGPVPEKLAWSYEFAVPSAGVPLGDSLVLILRTPDNHIAARVAARL